MSRIRYLYGSPTSSYLICTTPRSGSTFLSEALASTGVAGRPEEYFQQLATTGQQRRPVDYLGEEIAATELPAAFSAPDGDFRVELMFDPRRFATFGDYATWVIGTATTSNGVFGAKIMSAYVEGLAAGLRDALGDRAPGATPEVLAAAFPRLRYVRLVRADKVKQAVSLWRAIQTWQWREDAAPGAVAASGGGDLRYSFPALDRLRSGLVAEEEWWDAYFADAGISPLTVVYEEFSGKPDQAVRAVLRYLEIPFEEEWALPSPTMRRQADTLSQEWAERYTDEAAVTAGEGGLMGRRAAEHPLPALPRHRPPRPALRRRRPDPAHPAARRGGRPLPQGVLRGPDLLGQPRLPAHRPLRALQRDARPRPPGLVAHRLPVAHRAHAARRGLSLGARRRAAHLEGAGRDRLRRGGEDRDHAGHRRRARHDRHPPRACRTSRSSCRWASSRPTASSSAPRSGEDRYVAPPPNLPTRRRLRRDMAAFNASARSLDAGVGAVLDEIDALGLRDDTLVICTTDHGMAFPGAKTTLTDRGHRRVPDPARAGRVHGRRGERRARLAHRPLPDDLRRRPRRDAGLPPGHVAAAAHGRRARQCGTRCSRRGRTTPPTSRSARSARTRWKYIRRFDDRPTPVLAEHGRQPRQGPLAPPRLGRARAAPEQLYDLVLDPQEQHNLDRPARPRLRGRRPAHAARGLDARHRRPAAGRAGAATARRRVQRAGPDVGAGAHPGRAARRAPAHHVGRRAPDGLTSGGGDRPRPGPSPWRCRSPGPP